MLEVTAITVAVAVLSGRIVEVDVVISCEAVEIVDVVRSFVFNNKVMRINLVCRVFALFSAIMVVVNEVVTFKVEYVSSCLVGVAKNLGGHTVEIKLNCINMIITTGADKIYLIDNWLMMVYESISKLLIFFV
jgi:hypothetical protein